MILRRNAYSAGVRVMRNRSFMALFLCRLTVKLRERIKKSKNVLMSSSLICLADSSPWVYGGPCYVSLLRALSVEYMGDGHLK